MRALLRQDAGTRPAASAVGRGEESADPVVGEFTVQALRGGPVRLDGPKSLLRVLTTCDLTRLAKKLCLQEHSDPLGPRELAAVYQE